MGNNVKNDFSSPDEGDGVAPARHEEEFESPSEGQALASEALDAEIDSFLAGVDSQILSAKAELEKLLGSAAGASVYLQTQDVSDANIVGVGIGFGSASDFAGRAPGDPVLEVYTIEPEAPETTRSRLASAAGVQALASSDFPLHVVHTGIIDAQPHRFRERPAPGGVSVGHKAITAGTLGSLSRGRGAPRNARLLVLSNNHVLANVNAGAIGDAILQPGPYDGGANPADQIAVLERYIPINFAAGASNTVDCATAWAWPDRVRREKVYVAGGAKRYFTTGLIPVAPSVGMQVGKSGRTTQLTRGGVTAVGVTVNVNYGGGRVARFVDQFSVRAASGDFSQGGDSGSLIWTWDARRAPVGLLFAGGGGTTFANRITNVLNALDINLY